MILIKENIHRGLTDIYVDTTEISLVNGNEGKLIYRGYPIETLVHQPFLKVAYLLLQGVWPEDQELLEFTKIFKLSGTLSRSDIHIINALPTNLHPIRVLQGLVPLFEERQQDSVEEQGINLIAKIHMALAAYYRKSKDLPILDAQPDLDLLDNFFYCFHGRQPSSDESNIFRVTQIIQMEHGFNASTFVTRSVASTLASIPAAIAAGIGTLSGSLHGGADEAALRMAKDIPHISEVDPYIRRNLANKQKIMGMGHRVYRVVDPRANILKPLARNLCSGSPFEQDFLILEEVERVMESLMKAKGKAIKANVEFYKGAVLQALGFPMEYFTSLFACARIFGYVAHFLESRKDNKLVRPKAYYIGQRPSNDFNGAIE